MYVYNVTIPIVPIQHIPGHGGKGKGQDRIIGSHQSRTTPFLDYFSRYFSLLPPLYPGTLDRFL
mgnify:CR=1 FL=1